MTILIIKTKCGYIFIKKKIFDFAHRRFNLINILWKTLLKNTKKVDNSRGALSKQAFLEYFLSINTSSRKI